MAQNIIREYTLKLSTKEAQQELRKTTELLDLQDAAINRIKNDLIKYEKALKNSGSYIQQVRIREAIERTKIELKEELVAREKLTKQKQKDTKAVNEAKKNANDFSGAMRVLDAQTGGAASAMSGLVGGVGKATKGFGRA